MEANARMSTTNPLALARRARSRALALALLAALLGCDDLEQDKFLSQGGISPDPSARIEGNVLYIGPRPRCEWEGNRPKRVIGRVFLTLFEYTNPPPPEGTAQSSLNLVAVDGEKLFPLSDCLARDEAPDPAQRITRSVPFQWPRLTLLPDEASYQIRGFYDYDEDMVPFFSATRIPTAGDVIGAALNDIQDASKGLLRITLPPLSRAQDGFVLPGITVALGNTVRTERPIFRFDQNRKLSAETPFLIGEAGLNGGAILRAARYATCATPKEGGDGTSCGLTVQRLSEDDKPKLDSVDVELAIENRASYAFYAEPVDIRTLRENARDEQVPDGKPDPHPFMGGLGIPWYTPMLIMTRTPDVARQPNALAIEQQARIPRVLMVGSVLMDDTTLVPTKSSYANAPMGVLPIAAAELITGRTECRVPYFPPGSFPLLTANRVAHCGELPSGYYAPNVLGGIAGGTASEPMDPATSESGRVITGGRYSGQSWSIPNELGDPLQVGPENVVAGQSLRDGAFIVYDPDGNREAVGGMCEGAFPRCAPEQEPEYRNSTLGFTAADQLSCLPDACCVAVEHLCNVPRCEISQREDGSFLADSPTMIVGTHPNGAGIPDCIPFEMPWQCCPRG
jgi:hypothetical protein